VPISTIALNAGEEGTLAVVVGELSKEGAAPVEMGFHI
jgi:hypothetical protein